MQKMLDAGIATRRGVMCAHREPAYVREPWASAAFRNGCDRSPGLGESEKAQDQTIILPLFHQMTEADQDIVANALKMACAR